MNCPSTYSREDTRLARVCPLTSWAGWPARRPDDSRAVGEGGGKGQREALLTFGIDPLRVQVGESRLIAQLLKRFLRLLVDLEYTTRPPSPGRLFLPHVQIRRTASSRGFCARVVRDGAGEDDWGRHFGGVGELVRGGGYVGHDGQRAADPRSLERASRIPSGGRW